MRDAMVPEQTSTASRAALYLRVSTGRQAESDLSIPTSAANWRPTARARAGPWVRCSSSLATPPPTTAGRPSRR